MFMGEYSHSVDAKGRLIVPAKFREQLGDQFVVTKGVDGCLYVYSQEEWKRIEEKFREVNLTTKDARKFMRFFFAGAAMCEVDKQGRILIPSVLRDFAGLEKTLFSWVFYPKLKFGTRIVMQMQVLMMIWMKL